MSPNEELDFDAIEEVTAKMKRGETIDAEDTEPASADYDEFSMDDTEPEERDEFLEDFNESFDDSEEEEGEEEEEEKEEEEETEEEEEEGFDKYAKLRDDILSITEEGTVLKAKNKEINVEDLSKDELIRYLQKGMYADGIMQEVAGLRRQLDNEKVLVERGAQTVQSLLAAYGPQGKQAPGTKEVEVPDALKPTEYDTDEVKGLKGVAAEMFKELNDLKTSSNEAQIRSYEDQILSEVKTYKKEFPLASVDEVLAVKSTYPKADIGELMEASNRYYASEDFLRKAIKENPTFMRVLKDEFTKEQKVKEKKTKKVPLKSARTSGSAKVSTRKTPNKGFGYSVDDARNLSLDYLREVERMHDELD